MMKAEMAREMMRSRSQTPKPEPTRSDDAAGRGATTAPVGGVGVPASPPEPGDIEFSSMPALLYTEPACVARVVLRDQLAADLVHVLGGLVRHQGRLKLALQQFGSISQRH